MHQQKRLDGSGHSRGVFQQQIKVFELLAQSRLRDLVVPVVESITTKPRLEGWPVLRGNLVHDRN